MFILLIRKYLNALFLGFINLTKTRIWKKLYVHKLKSG